MTTSPPSEILDGAAIERRATVARGDVLTMTTVAGSGHPGGSLSTLDLLLAVLERADLRLDAPDTHRRDHLIVSHGHVSPAVYAALAAHGAFDRDELVATFRLAGSRFQGHVERDLPGIDWTTGNLGQGLAAACGFALAMRLDGDVEHTVYALGSDGEQTKGQVSEARRFAVHHGLDNLVTILDVNGLQISGATSDVMRVAIADEYRVAGWRVIEVDGHDHDALDHALADAGPGSGAPTCIFAHTVMGKGVPFIEHDHRYHGKALTDEEYGRAMALLGLRPEHEAARSRRLATARGVPERSSAGGAVVDAGERRVYAPGTDTDLRSGFGQALVDLGELNADLVVFDCDLAESVKTHAFAQRFPERFVQAGIQEHATATIAGALSVTGRPTFLAGYGAFVIDEVYNQQRLNALNGAHLKVVATHCGIDVGEDGPTHQVVDTIGLLRNLHGAHVLLPADPNQADAMTRWMASTPGMAFQLMGRSKTTVLVDAHGEPRFGADYTFRPGTWEKLRSGGDGLVVTWGVQSAWALAAADAACNELGIEVAVLSIPSLTEPTDAALASVGSPPWVVTVDDHWPDTGVGSWFAQRCHDSGVVLPQLQRLGPTAWPFSGAAKDVYGLVGVDVQGILTAIRRQALR